MWHYGIFSLCVLWVCCMIGNTYSITTGPASSKPENQSPDRRFYFYNPEIIPHAAAALGMVVPQIYKPMAAPLGPSLTPLHYYDYGGEEEEEEEVEEHEEKRPLQLFTIVKPPKMSKFGKKKKKKGQQHQQHKPLKQFKKLVKKCLPFKVRIIKKSDIDSGDNLFYQNIRSQLPYGYGDEYFPQPPDKQELAVISLNTSNISENGASFPQVLHFLYPRYNIQQPRSRPRVPLPRKTYRFARPPKRHLVRPIKLAPRRPWPKVNPWRVAPPGRPVLEYPLKEPTPDAVGGSPPPSPLLKLQKDPRIPVGEAFVVDRPTEQAQVKVTPNYIYVESTTPTQIQYYQEQWKDENANSNLNVNRPITGYDSKYSDPDYYEYGTYNQDQLRQENQQQKYVPENGFNGFSSADQEAQYNTKYDTISQPSYSYQSLATTTEKVVMVTPSTSWVPIPQLSHASANNVNDPDRISKFRNTSSLENKQINFVSGGFKNLTSSSYKFGDKIVVPRNCSLQKISNNGPLNNCFDQAKTRQQLKENTYKRVVNSRAGSKYYNKQKGISLKADSIKRSSQSNSSYNKHQDVIPNPINSEKFYVDEVSVGPKPNVTYHSKSLPYKNSSKIKARGFKHPTKTEEEIVTAQYPQDNLNEIYSKVASNGSNYVRARRSHFMGLSAVVSGSMLVREN